MIDKHYTWKSAVALVIKVLRYETAGIQHGDRGRRDAGGVDKLFQYGEHQVRRRIEPVGRAMINGVVHVDLDGDLLVRSIAHVPPPMRPVEVSESRLPGFGVALFIREPPDRLRDHPIYRGLIIVDILPPVSSQVPGDRLWVVYPHHAPRVNALAASDRRKGAIQKFVGAAPLLKSAECGGEVTECPSHGCYDREHDDTPGGLRSAALG